MARQELPKAMILKIPRPLIYEMWEKGGYFKPWNDPNNKVFSTRRLPSSRCLQRHLRTIWGTPCSSAWKTLLSATTA